MSGVSVRPRPRLPGSSPFQSTGSSDRRSVECCPPGGRRRARSRLVEVRNRSPERGVSTRWASSDEAGDRSPPRDDRRPAVTGDPPYTSPAMQITTTPAPKSTVELQIELPPERLDQAIREAVQHLSKRTRVPGFRPGKAPRPMLERVLGPGAVLDDAVEHLVERAYREALIEEAILPLTNADVEVVQAEEGKPFVFKATVQVRPEVELGDYKQFNFEPEIETIDDARVDQVVEELRDQNATLTAVEDRGAEGRRLRGHRVRRLARRDAVRGRVVGPDAAHPGPGAPDTGVRGEPRRAASRASRRRSTSRSPTTTASRSWPARPRTSRWTSRSCARRSSRSWTTTSSIRWATSPTSRRCAATSSAGSRGTRSTAPATSSPTGSSTTRSPTPPSSCPRSSIDQEVEVMHDEFRGQIARQGITEEAYLKVTEKTEADLHEQFRPGAEKRVKTLLVLSKVADVEGVEVPESDIDAEVARGRERYGVRPEAHGLLRVRARAQLHPKLDPSEPRGRDDHRRLADGPPRSSGRCRTSRTPSPRPSTATRRRANDVDRRHDPGLESWPMSQRPPARPTDPPQTLTWRGRRCSSRWSSNRPAEASAPTTSTRGSCVSGSSSSAMRSRTTSPTS